jgi:DNA polymerase III subunit chi
MAAIDVDFYLLETTSVEESGRAICLKLEEFYLQGKKIYVNIETHELAKWLDDQLWTFRDVSFVPHSFVNDEKLQIAPIKIGYLASPTESYDILFNLTKTVPDYFANFTHIVEIVPNSEALKIASREKYKFYRNHNCRLNTL